MNYVSEWLQKTLGMSPTIQLKLLISVFVVLGLWIIPRLILRIVLWRVEDTRIRYRWNKAFGLISLLLGCIVVAFIWLEEFQSIMTFLGLVAAGVTIALKDPIVDVAGWIYILLRRPIEVGDRVQIGEHAGDVIDMRILRFTLMEIGNWVDADQSTGRIIHIPNGKVFVDPLANYSKGFQYIWNEIPVLITFESNWEKAKEILHNIANKHAEHLSEPAREKVKEAAQKFMIFYSKLTPIIYTSVKDSGVLLTTRYLCEPRRRRGSAEAIWEDILREFAKCDDIDFAYPTQRFYNNLIESKKSVKSTSVDIEIRKTENESE
ncbi:MAG: mechanosensitive ion channel family protein [Planctomycetota bacterium]|nr:MAG: mechanosensitive ion channel family protein [Planctomycetota bacterium]